MIRTNNNSKSNKAAVNNPGGSTRSFFDAERQKKDPDQVCHNQKHKVVGQKRQEEQHVYNFNAVFGEEQLFEFFHVSLTFWSCSNGIRGFFPVYQITASCATPKQKAPGKIRVPVHDDISRNQRSSSGRYSCGSPRYL